MRARTAGYRLAVRLRQLRDRALYPEASGAGDQWQRVALDRSVDAWIEQLDPARSSAVEISGRNHARRPWKQYENLDYPAFDLCATLSEERRFDVVICEQVLEHVADPAAAAQNLRRLCTPGGAVVVSTPFLVKVHEEPEHGMPDYWRFTPRGLRQLLERAGLEVEEVHSWGNRQCVVGNIRVWSAYRAWHSLHDEPDLPVQVWAFARAR